MNNAIIGSDFVFHLAANADVRFGTDHPSKDLQQNTIATFNILEAMRVNGIKKIAFHQPVRYMVKHQSYNPGRCTLSCQTSLYGASKLACEGLIEAYCEGFGFQSWIFRFVSILGERYTHGHVFDFYRQLLADPTELIVLGDGHQKKSYLYVQDCIDAILCAITHSNANVNIFNLGTDEYCEVNDSISWICEHIGVNPKRHYTGGERGWIGDNPFIFLDCSKIRSLVETKIFNKEGIIKPEYLEENQWVLEKR